MSGGGGGAVGGRRAVRDPLPRGYEAPPEHSILRGEFDTDLWCALCGDRLTVRLQRGSVQYLGCRNDPRVAPYLREEGGR